MLYNMFKHFGRTISTSNTLFKRVPHANHHPSKIFSGVIFKQGGLKEFKSQTNLNDISHSNTLKELEKVEVPSESLVYCDKLDSASLIFSKYLEKRKVMKEKEYIESVSNHDSIDINSINFQTLRDFQIIGTEEEPSMVISKLLEFKTNILSMEYELKKEMSPVIEELFQHVIKIAALHTIVPVVSPMVKIFHTPNYYLIQVDLNTEMSLEFKCQNGVIPNPAEVLDFFDELSSEYIDDEEKPINV